MLVVAPLALGSALRSRNPGFPVGRSVLDFVRHLAQFASDAEIETRSRQTAAASCQFGEKFGVGHTYVIPAAGENPRRQNVPTAAPAKISVPGSLSAAAL